MRHPRNPRRRLGTSLKWRERAETGALWAVSAGVALLLLTPFVVSIETAYPFVVGKAVYSRTVIEVLFALWAVLAFANPRYRPPRSWLLAWFGIGFACSVVAALFGVSVARSVWSNFERMQGVVDAAHWLALAVVLAGAFRCRRDLLAVVHVHLGVSALVALLAITRFHDLGVPFFGALPEPQFPRIGGVFGNPLFLASYAAVNAVLALGLGACAARGGSRRALTISLCALVAYLNVHALALADARSGWLGLAAAVAFCGLAYVVWGKSRHWRIAVAATMLAGLVGGGALLAIPQTGGKVLERLAAAANDESARQRGAALLAGLRGFLERPVTGFGPENFVVPWGRHASGAVGEAHDSAHNRVVDKAATEGLLGLGAHAVLWVLLYLALIRRARRASGTDERLFLLTLGAALTCFLVNDQLRFPTTVWNLQQVLLLVLVVGLEPRRETRMRVFAKLDLPKWIASAHVGAKAAVAAAAFAGLAVSSSVNVAIYFAAVDIGRLGVPGQPAKFLERAIERFEPLANTPRLILFEQLAEHWRRLRVRESAEALRLLAVADAQAPLAVAAEPSNWRVHHALARLYHEVANGDPAYRAVAARHLAQSQALAPHVPVRFAPETRAWRPRQLPTD